MFYRRVSPPWLLLYYYTFFAVNLLVLYINGYVLSALKVVQNRDSIAPVSGVIVIKGIRIYGFLPLS